MPLSEITGGATNLEFVTSGGSGDADLFVKFGSAPTLNSYDCKSTSSTSNESCNITNIRAGTYHVMVQAWNRIESIRISNVSLTGSYVDNPGPGPGPKELQNGVPVTGISDAAKEEFFYTMAVPSGASSLRFVTRGSSGDADLFVKFGYKPTLSSYDCKSTSSNSNETCNISSSRRGTYNVMVQAWNRIRNVSLTGSYRR